MSDQEPQGSQRQAVSLSASKIKQSASEPSYDVGYGKPPIDRQFKKGKSGNPNGRPKGCKNRPPEATQQLRQLIIHEAYRDVTIQEKDGPVSMSVAQAAIRSMAIKAAKGSVMAQKLFLTSLSAVENETAREQEELFAAVSDYKRQKLAYIEECKHCGQEPEEMLPHPDDIELDLRAGKVIFHGPIDETDKAVWNDVWGRKAGFEDELASLYEHFEEIKSDENVTLKEIILDDITATFWLLELADQTIMRRWHLPAKRLTDDFLRQHILQDNVKYDRWPKRPRRGQIKELGWEIRSYLSKLVKKRKAAEM